MNMIQELESKGTGIKHLKAPDSLDILISDSVQSLDKKKRKAKKSWIALAAMIAILIFTGYHFETFAFYAQKLVGYDPIMSRSLRDLSDLGKGQALHISKQLPDGTMVTLDHLMIDGNKMILFYRMSYSDVLWNDSHTQVQIKGRFESYPLSTSTAYYEEGVSEDIVVISEFKTPKWYERNLTITYWDGQQQVNLATVRIDRKKAMGVTIRQKLSYDVAYGRHHISLTNMTASPTSTLVYGKVDSVFKAYWAYINNDITRIEDVKIVLQVDGKTYLPIGSSMTTDMRGMTFTGTFDALPLDATSIEARIESFYIRYRPKRVVALEADGASQKIDIEGHIIEIKDVKVEDTVRVTLLADSNIRLYDVALEANGKDMPFESIESNEKGERVLVFKGTEIPTHIIIGQLYVKIEL